MSEQMKQQRKMTLVVTNTQVLEAGLSPTHTFTEEGGTIGSGSADSWNLRAPKSAVRLAHAGISIIDDHFCLTDRCGACYINGATIPVGWNRSVRLSENDVLMLGPYRIRAHFTDADELPTGNQHDLEKLFRRDYSPMNIGSEDQAAAAQNNNNEEPNNCDPLAALDALKADLSRTAETRVRETEAADIEQKTEFLLAKDQQWQGQELTVHADSDREVGAAVALQNILTREDHPMNENILDNLEAEMGRDYPHRESTSSTDADTNGSSVNHMVAGPMLRGMGSTLENTGDMAAMQILAEEVGASIQATIRGMLNLHEQVSTSRYGMMNKNLQPIEDNPLRMGQSYEETVATMFAGERSAVHLSAPAAIEESLNNIRIHNQVVQVAVTYALRHVLRAFSPDVLLRRFNSYRRTGDVSQGSSDAWAWKMYENYYRELNSKRQQGLEKLFWEVFDQAYDKVLRKKQAEEQTSND